VEFIDLKSQQKRIRDSLNIRIKKVLDESRYILGEEVRELESELSLFSGSKYCVSCANGTDALMLALMALDIGPNDGVITVPFTYIATLEAIAVLGATPILVDIYDSTFNMNPELIEDAIAKSDKTIKAIIPVDLFGLPARYRMINEIASKHNIKIIGDAAQSFGASKNNQKVGTFSDITTTSFFPAKPLGCYGDGGALFTNSQNIEDKLRSLRVHGKGVDKYDNIRIGMNSRLDTLQAAILLEKLSIFSDEIVSRNNIAETYRFLLKDLPLKFQIIPEGYESVYAQFSIVFEDEKTRNTVQNKLSEHKIPSIIYYGISGHLQTGYKYLNYQAGDFPVSESLSKKILSLPMHPYLLEKDIKKITNIIKTEF